MAITALNPIITLQAGIQPSKADESAKAQRGTWKWGRQVQRPRLCVLSHHRMTITIAANSTLTIFHAWFSLSTTPDLVSIADPIFQTKKAKCGSHS